MISLAPQRCGRMASMTGILEREDTAFLGRTGKADEAGVSPTESQNHRIVGVGRDLCGSSSPPPLPKPLCQ